MNGYGSRKHVFISHHHADDETVDNFTTLLSGRGYDVRNSSVRMKPANKARMEQGRVSDEVIRRALRMKISWAGTCIVLIGEGTHSRPWVNWEIDQAAAAGKRIVGVWLRGGTMNEVPSSLAINADAVVGWNSDRIVDAIEGRINNWQGPNGDVVDRQDIPRILCQ